MFWMDFLLANVIELNSLIESDVNRAISSYSDVSVHNKLFKYECERNMTKTKFTLYEYESERETFCWLNIPKHSNNTISIAFISQIY